MIKTENRIELLSNENNKRENEFLLNSNFCFEENSEEEIYGKKTKEELNEKLETNSNTNSEKNSMGFINKKKIRDSNKSQHDLENQNLKRIINDIHLTLKKENEDKNCIKKVENEYNHLNFNIKNQEILNEEVNKKNLNDNNIKNEEIINKDNIQNKNIVNANYTSKEENIILKDETINPFFSTNENFIIY